MTLLTEMMQRPLDPGYAAAAARRESQGLTPSTGLRSPVLVAFAVLVGLLFAASAVALRVPETTSSKAKADLVTQIESRRERADQQTARIAGLRRQIDAAHRASLRLQSQGGIADRLSALEVVAGVVPVTGPGLRVTVDDAAEPAAGTPDDPEAGQGKVLARDLQIVVNGLWLSGAEAIAVNGHRLTARSAIRFAGEAILVDYRPLTRPYVIQAIGDVQEMGIAFASSDGGGYLQSLKSNFKVRADIEEVQAMTLRGQPSLSTRSAKPVQPATPPPSATPGGSATSRATTGPPTATTKDTP